MKEATKSYIREAVQADPTDHSVILELGRLVTVVGRATKIMGDIVRRCEALGFEAEPVARALEELLADMQEGQRVALEADHDD